MSESPDLRGRIAVVTGANRGLGQAMTQRLLKAGATVHMACRRESAAYACLGEIKSNGVPTERAKVQRIDLSSVQGVRTAAQDLVQRVPHIDLVVLNAGVFRLPPELSVDGVERHFAVNYLGHFVLVAHLWPAILRSAQARIVGVSSRLETLVPERFRDPSVLDGRGPWSHYAFSKRCLLSFCLELDRRLQARGAPHRALAGDPGFVGTSLLTSGGTDGILGRFRTGFMRLGGYMFGQTPDVGCRSLWKASVGDLAQSTGLVAPKGWLALSGEPDWIRPSNASRHQEFVRTLWSFSERFASFTP